MIKLFQAILFYLCLILVTSAQGDSAGVKIPGGDKERLLINNFAFSVSDFLVAYMGNDINQRRLAEMYLIGALNASEGKEWCSYRGLLPTSIQEEIYIGFKYKTFDPNQQAVDAILSIMSDTLPCQENDEA